MVEYLVVSWVIIGVITGILIVRSSYKLSGKLSLGDVFRVVVLGPLLGVVGFVLYLFLISDDVIIFKRGAK